VFFIISFSVPIASYRGQEDKIHLAMARRFLDLFHYPQSTIGTTADNRPTTLPGNVFLDRERSMPVRAAKLTRSGLFAFADLSVVDEQVMVAGHAIDPHRTE